MNRVSIYIEGEKLDLFEDENIRLSSSIQNISDISKVFADFTLDFNVPASKTNNKVFKHYYNADIDGGFDARVKKQCVIYINDLEFKRGKLRLLSTSLKDKRIDSYKVNYVGDVVKIKDLVGDDKLTDLDFSEYNHTYDSNNVLSGLTSNLLGVINYPLISPIRSMFYDFSDSILSNASQVNLHYNSGIDSNSIDYKELKPSIKVSAIVNKIKDTYGLDFNGDIFNRINYTQLSMWLNKDEGNLVPSGTANKYIIDWDGGSDAIMKLATNTATIVNKWYNFRWTITPDTGFENIQFTFHVEVNGIETYNFTTVGNIVGFLRSNAIGTTNAVKMYVSSSEVFEFTATLEQSITDVPGTVTGLTDTTTASSQSISPIVDISYNMPDIKCIDFIEGLIKAFNISLVGNQDGSITWQALPDFYKSGKIIKDLDKYIDIEKLDISRGTLNNEIKFNYENPTTILAQRFKEINGVAYGDLEQKILDTNGDKIDGNPLTIKIPFSNMVYERLRDIDSGVDTSIQYGLATDKNLKAVATKGLLFYNIKQNVLGNPIGFLDNTDTLNEINTFVNIPSHSISLADADAENINFNAELSTYSGEVMTGTLYKLGYSDYISDMFSSKRRLYKFKGYLPTQIIEKINLNDRLILSNRRFIINKINTNLVTSEVNLELLNDIYTAGDLVTDQFYTNRQFMIIDPEERELTITVYGEGSISFANVDEGDGTFVNYKTVSPVTNTSEVLFDVLENNTGYTRTQSIEFTKGLETIKVYITQETYSVDFSSEIITFDNDIITWDNEQ